MDKQIRDAIERRMRNCFGTADFIGMKQLIFQVEEWVRADAVASICEEAQRLIPIFSEGAAGARAIAVEKYAALVGGANASND